jgi:hypothetical protein
MKLLLLLIFLPFVANAYIDPGSGSAIMSAIVGFFVAIGIAVKTYWYKIKSLFGGKKPTNDSEEE